MASYSLWPFLIALVLVVSAPVVIIWLLIRLAGRRSNATPSERLRELARIREGGLITDDEYEHKRRDVLQQL